MSKPWKYGISVVAVGCLVAILALWHKDIPGVLAPVDSELVSANNEFGFDLFQQILEETPDKNVFISPSSIAIALQMTCNGAGGSTREAMAETLRIKDMESEKINAGAAGLLSALNTRGSKVTLSVANSLWGSKDISFDENFIRQSKEYFDAQVTSIDFQSPLAVSEVNSWINRKTGGMIRKAVSGYAEDSALLLVNAVYFKGIWTNKFDKQDTRDREFYLQDGSTKTVRMMRQTLKHELFYGDRFSGIRLPYGDGRIAMYVFLPKGENKRGDLCEILAGDDWKDWPSKFRKQRAHLVLPRFKSEYSVRLNEALTELGMGEAFDRLGADFDNLGTRVRGPVFVEEVAHNSFIEVDEAGTRAAAATRSLIIARSGQPVFLVDRPFLFAIRDDGTGAILFLGSIQDPTQ